MSQPHDRHDLHDGRASPHGPPSTAGAELLPVLVWLNRLDLSTRFPTWQPRPEAPVGEPVDTKHH